MARLACVGVSVVLLPEHDLPSHADELGGVDIEVDRGRDHTVHWWLAVCAADAKTLRRKVIAGSGAPPPHGRLQRQI